MEPRLSHPNLSFEEQYDLLGEPCEPARTEWLAATAARRYAEREPLAEIETELLEALAAILSAELQDRNYRNLSEGE